MNGSGPCVEEDGLITSNGLWLGWESQDVNHAMAAKGVVVGRDGFLDELEKRRGNYDKGKGGKGSSNGDDVHPGEGKVDRIAKNFRHMSPSDFIDEKIECRETIEQGVDDGLISGPDADRPIDLYDSAMDKE